DNEECEEETLCSQTCLETKGSYRCSCLPGYSLQPDKISCTNWEGPEYVVLVKNGSLSLINHRNLIMKKVDLPLGTQVDSLDYDPVNRQHLYVD
ncbi:Low-density lipoprotein receptor-related protein 4-like 1, partial [Homarus americanus]